MQGAATVKSLIPDAITIFVAADDELTLVKRLVERKTESLDKLAVRTA
jgi:guanylate kinase